MRHASDARSITDSKPSKNLKEIEILIEKELKKEDPNTYVVIHTELNASEIVQIEKFGYTVKVILGNSIDPREGGSYTTISW